MKVEIRTGMRAMALPLSLSAALVASGCSQTGQTDKQDAGIVLGAVAGGLLGSQFGSGGGKVAATVIGAAAGAAIGGAIGAAMDEEDRQELARLTDESFETGSVRTYQSPRTGARVKVHIVKTARVNKQICRTAAQDIELSDGAKSTEKVTACKGPNGWVV